jgi:hypothetical protein
MKNILFIIIIFLVSGCGYTTRGFVYEDDKIIIDPVVNKIDITSEQRKYSGYATFPILIENKLTNELVGKFNTDGHLEIVNQGSNALRLTCTITNYTKETLRYTDSDEVEEQRLRLHVQIKLVSSKGKELQDREVVGESSYFLSGTRQKSESSAQIDLVDDTARRILEAVVEAW